MSDSAAAAKLSGDAIHIEQLELFVHVGVPDHERAKPQRITVSVTAWPRHQISNLGDDLSRTVNYSAMARLVRNFAAEQRTKLIETLAENIAAQLLAGFPLRQIRIELRKYVLPDARFVSVTLVREQTAK